MHFNDLELRIRNFAITVLAALLTGAGLTLKDNVSVILCGYNVPVASLLLGTALIAWTAFYCMDAFWYHQLLLGAVTHGENIETDLKQTVPGVDLTHTIGANLSKKGSQNARDISRNTPTFVNKFKVPGKNLTDVLLLETARAFHADSEAVKAIFTGYGLPDNFRDTLQTLIDEFDAAINAQDTAKRGRIDANATIDDIIDRALSGRRTLLVIIPNIFAGNPGKLADWASASHIEKLPKPKPAPTTPTP